jgi:hypothetical protein
MEGIIQRSAKDETARPEIRELLQNVRKTRQDIRQLETVTYPDLYEWTYGRKILSLVLNDLV